MLTGTQCPCVHGRGKKSLRSSSDAADRVCSQWKGCDMRLLRKDQQTEREVCARVLHYCHQCSPCRPTSQTSPHGQFPAPTLAVRALGGDLPRTTNLKKPVAGLSRPAHSWLRLVGGWKWGPRSGGGEGGGRLRRAACLLECCCCCIQKNWQLEPEYGSS